MPQNSIARATLRPERKETGTTVLFVGVGVYLKYFSDTGTNPPPPFHRAVVSE
jgi:hypothetical protein